MFLTTRVSEAPLRSMHLELLFAPPWSWYSRSCRSKRKRGRNKLPNPLDFSRLPYWAAYSANYIRKKKRRLLWEHFNAMVWRLWITWKTLSVNFRVSKFCAYYDHKHPIAGLRRGNPLAAGNWVVGPRRQLRHHPTSFYGWAYPVGQE